MSEGTGLEATTTADLRALLGDRFVTSSSVREHHGKDESPLPPELPDAVAFVQSTSEVSAVVSICRRDNVPVVPFGSGTSLEGHVLALRGGISLDLTGMSRILAVRVDDMDVTVEAGVTRKALNDRLARDGLLFPVDPGADATLGGMASTGASGTTTVKYGAMRENVLSLRVVLADGSVIDTARRARKSSAGYDLTRLFIGSEGTLGVITEVTLRTYGLPEAISSALCHFPTTESAVQAVITTLQMGIDIARVEFVDELAIKAINGYFGASYPVAPLLLFDFHGSREEVTEQTLNVQDVVTEAGAVDFRSAIGAKERSELWAARHESFYASLSLRPGSKAITTDVCVPISRLAECILETREDISRFRLTATIVGHVGDGNFHVMILVDPDDPEEITVAEEMNDRLVERALLMDGTCTGEHGVGLRKKKFLERELPGALEVMRSIKRTLDPTNIMNPGKVLDI
jgi:D-lactate dehydrogenase (cytochrome)